MLEEAWSLLVERGLADLSLSELGRRLGTSAGHLSYYFGSKNGLLLALLQWSEDELAAERDAILASGTPAAQRLHALCVLNFPRAPGDPRWLLWAELWPRVPHEPDLRTAQQTYDAQWFSAVEQVVREFTDDTVAVTQRVIALMNGMGISLLMGDPDLTIEVACAHVLAVVPRPR